MSRTGNYNVYTRNPAINKPEFTHIAGLKHETRVVVEDESEAARMARKRLYGRREAEERPRHMSKAQRQKIAREQVLDTLMDPMIIDTTKITGVMADWATNDLGVDDQVSQRIFTSALVTTESVPNKNVFRIRIKL